jgi:prepilin-type N-terminal cleavage/methylation domain-containing protein
MKSKGFTLIELAVVLAIIAVLAAILTPMVTGYLDQARIARAQADARTVADAIKLYQRDTGRWPVYATNGDYTASPKVVGGTKNFIVGSNGNYPTDGTATWGVTAGTAAAVNLEGYLNQDLSSVGTAAFPKAGFRGPYIGALDSDPWGNRYILTAKNLDGTTNHAFVISAGPNGLLDTGQNQGLTAVFANTSDDIIAVIK